MDILGAGTVAFMDIGLPGMDGYEVARAIRNAGRALTLVAVAGYAQPDHVRHLLERGRSA